MKLTRIDALRIIEKVTDNEGLWESVTEGHYDEEADDLPTIYDVLEPLGVSREEFDAAVGVTNG